MKAIVHVQDAINITRIHRTHVNKGLKEQSYDLYKRDGKVLHKRARWIKKGDCYSWWGPVGAIGCLTTYTANYGNRKKSKDRQNGYPSN